MAKEDKLNTPTPLQRLEILRLLGINLHYSQLAQTWVVDTGTSQINALGPEAVALAFYTALVTPAPQNPLMPRVDGEDPHVAWFLDDRRNWARALMGLEGILAKSTEQELDIVASDNAADLAAYANASDPDIQTACRAILPQLSALFRAEGIPHRHPIAVIPWGHPLLPDNLRRLEPAIFKRLTLERQDTAGIRHLIDGTSRSVSKGLIPVLEAPDDVLTHLPPGAEAINPDITTARAWQDALTLLALPSLRQLQLHVGPRSAQKDMASLAAEVVAVRQGLSAEEAVHVAAYVHSMALPDPGLVLDNLISATGAHLKQIGFEPRRFKLRGIRKTRWAGGAHLQDTITAEREALIRDALAALEIVFDPDEVMEESVDFDASLMGR